jgi:hypothetical protein
MRIMAIYPAEHGHSWFQRPSLVRHFSLTGGLGEENAASDLTRDNSITALAPPQNRRFRMLSGITTGDGAHRRPAALHCTGAIDTGIRAGLAQVAGAAIHVARATSSLCGQTGAARAVTEAALRRAGAGGRAVTAPVAIASRAIETTATRPTSITGATAARGAGATLDQGVAGA